MYRTCSECNKNTIKNTEESWKKTCKGCFIKKLKTMKKCNTCNKLNIPKDSFKEMCNSCYSQDSKECINYAECGNYIIGDENMWKDKCVKCYKEFSKLKENDSKI